MLYLIHKDKPGETITTGDFLSVNFIHQTESDSVLASSYVTGHPELFEQQDPFFKGDIFDGLAMLSEGDSATFKLNFDSMQVILNVPKPESVKDKYLLFTVKVEKVISRAEKSDSEFEKEVRAFYAAELLRRKPLDSAKSRFEH